MSGRQNLDNEMLHLQQEILKMGTLVEVSVKKAMEALVKQNLSLANQVIYEDRFVDEMETGIEDQCIVLIAREQPVAHDLRSLVSILKVVSHLERMGDHGVHLARSVLRLGPENYTDIPEGISRMAEIACSMIKEVLTAFINQDKEAALLVARRDDKIDKIHMQLLKELLVGMKNDSGFVDQAANFLFVSRFLERLGDHVVDICEWVIYSRTGEHPDLNKKED